MTTVLISGWSVGFQKAEFTRLMKTELGLTLGPAKRITDRVTDGDPVELTIPDAQVEDLLAAITDLGAICEAAAVQRHA